MNEKDRCLFSMGVAYNEISKPIKVQCMLKRNHNSEHIGKFSIHGGTHKREGEIRWSSQPIVMGGDKK